MTVSGIPKQTLLRLPIYLNYLKQISGSGIENMSATKIAAALNLNHVVVRKDLASISNSGKPKVGYNVNKLIEELESFLGYNDSLNAVIVGAGSLGKALLKHEGFSECGFNIIAAFDKDPKALADKCANKALLPIDRLKSFSKLNRVKVGIITCPDSAAQEIADMLVDAEIYSIWNFTSVQLTVPEYVYVLNENMASSLILLSKHINGKQ